MLALLQNAFQLVDIVGHLASGVFMLVKFKGGVVLECSLIYHVLSGLVEGPVLRA